MSALTEGRHGWLGKQFVRWREEHGGGPSMTWNPRATGPKRCPYCKTWHGKYERKGAVNGTS